MAEGHGGGEDEGTDAAVLPVVHVGAADAGGGDAEEDVVRGGEGGGGEVLEFDVEGFVEDEARILWGWLGKCAQGVNTRGRTLVSAAAILWCEVARTV